MSYRIDLDSFIELRKLNDNVENILVKLQGQFNTHEISKTRNEPDSKPETINTSENKVFVIEDEEPEAEEIILVKSDVKVQENPKPIPKDKPPQLKSTVLRDNILADLRFNRNLRSMNDDTYLRIKENTNLSLLALLMQYGQYKYANTLFENKTIDVDTIDNNGNHVLHYKFILENRDILDFLNSKQVRINVKNKEGQTPLMICCKYIDLVDTAKYLIGLNADINILDNYGANALYYACQLPINTYKDARITLNLVEKLLEKGADPNIVTNDLKNCLSVSSTDMISKVLKDNGAMKLNVLPDPVAHVFNEIIAKNITIIQKSVLYQIRDKKVIYDTETLITSCIKHYNKDLLNVFLDFGCDINQPNKFNEYPIHIATKSIDEIFDIVIAHKPNINVQNSLGLTPLMVAFSYKNDNKAKKLLEMNPDIFVLDKSGKSAIDYCPPSMISTLEKRVPEFSVISNIINNSKFNEKDVEKLKNINISYKGYTILTALLAKFVSNPEIIESFVKTYKPDPNLNNGDGLSPLVLSTMNFETFKIILNMDKLDVNGYVMDSMTNLDYLISNNLIKEQKMLEMLLAKHADINIPRKDGTRPFYNYIKEYKNMSDLKKYLLQKNYIIPNAPNSDGTTFLFSVVENCTLKAFKEMTNLFTMDFKHVSNDGRNVLFFVKHSATMTECIKNGANIKQVSKDGKTPLDVFIEKENKACARTLVEHYDFPFSEATYQRMIKSKDKDFKEIAENWKTKNNEQEVFIVEN